VTVQGSTTTARLTNCISHHNKYNGVFASDGAVVDLMGEGTSMHDNERYGLLNDMSHGNKRQNICRAGGTVQQKDSKK